MNKLLYPIFSTPYESIPFEEIKLTDFKPAFLAAIEKAKQEINQLLNQKEVPNFENTIEALENAGHHLKLVSSIFFNLNAAQTNDEMQTLAQEISPLLSQQANDIILNPILFERVKYVFDHPANNLSNEQKRLIEKMYLSFKRNGALLTEEQKKEKRVVDESLAKLSLLFGENVLHETNDYELLISDVHDLKGLSQDYIETARKAATTKQQEGWLVTLKTDSYVPFMTYAENRMLREKLFRVFASRGFQPNKWNNEANVLEIVRLRRKMASLLGYESYAAYILEERMAKNIVQVFTFIDDLLQQAKPVAIKEVAELQALAQLDDVELQRWDHAFYVEKLKQIKFNFDDEKLKPYFPLENAIRGVFELANRLYELHFEEIYDIQKYHEEVRTFKVTDDKQQFIALLYMDFYPRKEKRSGAWMTSFKGQSSKQRPHVSIVCNFTPPTSGVPSLLTFNELTTLFHEFGHALHAILANTVYESLSGTNVYWDFVELPSQILENWCYQKEALDLFAQHYQTKEKIAEQDIKNIQQLNSFMEAYQTVRQLSFAALDMMWHTTDQAVTSVDSFENNTLSDFEVYPPVGKTNMSVAFSHIFQGGYAAGYYSYKWAEVLDADAFAYFEEEGIFSKKVAKAFKDNVLSKGGTDDPMKLYVAFRWQKPDVKHLLKRAGLLEE